MAEEPLSKIMAEGQILEAIQGIKKSINSMKGQMKSFPTKSDLGEMVEEIKEVREAVNNNTSKIDKLFELCQSERNDLAREVERLVDKRIGSACSGGSTTINAAFLIAGDP